MRNIWIPLCMLLLAGCSKSDIEEVNTSIGAESPTFYASLEGSDETRTYLDENRKMRWHNDDRITVFCGNDNNAEYAFTGKTGATAGDFQLIVENQTGTGESVWRNYAVYPYAAATRIDNDGVISLQFPDYQQYAVRSFAPNTNVMVAVSDGLDDRFLPFKNAGGFLRLRLYGHQNVMIKSIQLQGNKQEKIAGAATVKAEHNKAPKIEMEDSATATITLLCEDGVWLSSNADDPTEFWVVLPPVDFDEGFTVTITDHLGATMTKTTTKSQKIERNMVKSMAAFEVKTSFEDVLALEREALIAFYHALDGDNWKNNTNWCSDKPVGEWYGIMTDEAGYVIHMVLYDNNLAGSIPESIADLKKLGVLNLDINKLVGELPESIGDLTELMQLTAVNNNFTGKIPESIGNLVNLQYLYLDSNQLSGELPASIGNLTNLTHLMLGYNNFTGFLPESINKMASLTNVFIPSNYFTGNVPERFMELENWQTNWHEILNQQGEGFSKEGLVIPAPKFREPTIDGKYLDYSVYSENEYTILYHYYDWCNWSYSFTPELVELYEGYKNKGLEVIAFSAEGTIDSHKNFAESLQTEWPYIMLSENKDIFNAHVWISPGVSVVDKTGHIVFNNYTDDYNDLGAFLLENLGSPDSSGPPEGPTFYESSDYSKDGEVKQLQKATKGKGIDVVLMGDAYTDRLIADGTYDTAMQSAMAKLFTEEPYKSFRDYFNVYSVTAVSRNEIYSSFSETAIRGYFGTRQSEVGGDDSKAFTYALKAIDEERLNQALVIVIMNSKVYAGTCYMYVPSVEGDWSNGVSVSYFPIGSDEVLLERLIHHEACGHGFAKLADEYSEGHIETFPEEDISLMQSEQNNLGWWKNVDFTNDLSQIRWSYFINDPRYADEGLGAFEGGLTYLTGVWRPTLESIMRYNWGGFNAPSREAIYYRIHKLAYGAEWQYDYEKFVEWDARNRAAAATRAMIYRPAKYQPTPPPVVINRSWRDAK